jgi:hypothetical protein
LKEILDTIKSNIGFNKLQEMREGSPTGGALGNVSDRENKLLQSVIASVEQSQSRGQCMANLRRVDVIFRSFIDGPSPDEGRFPIPFTKKDFDEIPSGSTYISPKSGRVLRKP